MTQQTQIRISARELSIDKGEPFQYDRLHRKPSCDLLTNLANCVDGPCTIAIDAAWGHGKTTFLQLWAAHLEQDAFLVIDVNAWKTDYFDDPFLAIVGEMTLQLKESGKVDVSEQSGFSKLKNCFAKVASIAPRALAAPYIALTDDDVTEIISTLKTDASIRLEQYKEQLDSVKAFRSELGSVAQEVWKETEKPLIVLVDELDRCRPTYAVEFLEVVKHLMAVDHVVYVFAINRSELAQTVSGCYGPGFNGKGYLRRFFDVDFTLPQPSRKSFINSHFEEQLEPLIPYRVQRDTKLLLLTFFDVDRISLRQIQQALHRFRLALVLAEQDTATFHYFAIEFCTALILRVYDPDILEEFLRGELSDKDVVERFLPSTVSVDSELFDARLLFGTAVVRAAQEIAGPNPSTEKYDPTPLLESYEKLATSTSVAPNLNSKEYFAMRLIENVQRLADPDNSYGQPMGVPHRFKRAVKRLEMLELLK
ncbi:MAG: P-loop NTPase fold protein [Bacteroidetes bacterium]|nr:P-loop NTPase fold protein [Bacteroidota bacterium]